MALCGPLCGLCHRLLLCLPWAAGYSDEAGRFFLAKAGQISEPNPDVEVYWLTAPLGSSLMIVCFKFHVSLELRLARVVP